MQRSTLAHTHTVCIRFDVVQMVDVFDLLGCMVCYMAFLFNLCYRLMIAPSKDHPLSEVCP